MVTFTAGCATQTSTIENSVKTDQSVDYVAVLKNTKQQVENGNAKAQYNLGVMYSVGIGVG